MKLKIFDKYIFGQVFLATCVCILLFMVIWIAPELLLKTIQRTLEGSYTVKMAVDILTYEIPKILGNAFPVGLLLGALFTFDKLSKDFELTIFRGIGISFWRILAPVITLSIIISALSFIVFDKMIPYSSNKLNMIKNENRGSHFVFPIKNNTGQMDKIIIVSSFDNNDINDLVVLKFSKNQYDKASVLNNIIISDYAVYKPGSWVLNDTKNYLISNEGIFEDIVKEKKVEILNGDKADRAYKLMMYSVKRDRELTNSQMFNYIKLLKIEQMDDEFRFMLNKYLQRYTHSFICILFAILGCLLGFSQPREQRLIGFTIAVAIIFLYYITMPFFDMLAEKGIASPILTAFIQPISIFIFIILLKKKKDL